MEDSLTLGTRIESASGQDLYVPPVRGCDVTDSDSHRKGNTTTANDAAKNDFLWGDLPDEVITTILACLPLSSLIRFGCVCKKWNILLRDRHFREMRARVWGTPLYGEYLRLMEKSSAFAGAQVKSSVGGLLLLTFEEQNDVYIVDPSMACQRQIPRLPNMRTGLYIGCGMLRGHNIRTRSSVGSRYYTVGMAMVPETKVFYVLAVSKTREVPLGLQLYDSFQDSWRLAGSLQPRPGEMNVHIVSVLLHDGSLHCMSASFNQDLCANFRVLRFDRQRKRWYDVVGAIPCIRYNGRSSPLLFEHRGRLLLAGAFRKDFYIWQHDPEKLEWRTIEFLPHVNLLGSETGFGLYSQACGDFLCVGTYPIRKCLAAKSTYRNGPVLIYNMLDRSWRLLQSPEVESRLLSWQNRRFLYDPSQPVDAAA